MRTVFYVARDDESKMKLRELKLAESLGRGASRHGDKVVIRSALETSEYVDASFAVGIKGLVRFCLTPSRRRPIVVIDKGYLRPRALELESENEPTFWKVSINNVQPLEYFQVPPRPGDRFEKLGVKIAPMRDSGSHIVYAGSSEKFTQSYRLGTPMDYAERVITEIRKHTDRPVVHRPKPSWAIRNKDKLREVPGATLSLTKGIVNDLRGAHALVTYGSNASFDALLLGVPVVTLGDSIARPVAEHSLANIENPAIPPPDVLRQWFHDVAYCQWTRKEMASGETWAYLRECFETMGLAEYFTKEGDLEDDE